MDPDYNPKVIFDFGTRDRENAFQNKIGIPDIQLFNLEMEEDQDKLAIKLIMKKYKKAFGYLFKKYANSGYNIKMNTFDGQKSSSSKISITNLWTFRRDFLEGLISK